MTNPKHTSSDLVERLRRTYRKEYVPTGSSVANPLDRLRPFPIAAVDLYHNPDGPEAADRIKQLEAALRIIVRETTAVSPDVLNQQMCIDAVNRHAIAALGDGL